MRGTLLTIMTSAVACTASAAVYECPYDSGSPSGTFAGGAITVSAENGRITSLVSTLAAGDTAVFTGDAMAFESDALVRLDGTGAVVFSNAVSSAGAMTFTSMCTNMVVTPPSILQAGSAAVVILPPDTPLGEYIPTVGDLTYNNGAATVKNRSVYFVNRSSDELSFQIQYYNGANTKACKVVFRKTEAGVTVSNEYFKAVSYKAEGMNFDMISEASSEGYPSSVSLVAQKTRGCRVVTFSGPCSFAPAGSLSIGGSVEVVCMGKALGLENSATFSNPVKFAGGTLVFRDFGAFTNASAVTGTNGDTFYEAGDFYVPDGAELTVSSDREVTTSDAVFLPGTSLASVTAVTARIKWCAYNSAAETVPPAEFQGDLRPAFGRNLGHIKVFRFQVQRAENGMGLCAPIVMTQRGEDVVVRKMSGWYAWGANQPSSADPWTWDPKNDPGTSAAYDAGKFNITNLTFHLSAPTGIVHNARGFVTIAGSDATTRSSLSVKGGVNHPVLVVATVRNSLPQANGALNIETNASFALYCRDTSLLNAQYGMWNSQSAPAAVSVRKGGLFASLWQKNTSVYQNIVSDGGDIVFYDTQNFNFEKSTTINEYIGGLSLSGGVASGIQGVRIGYGTFLPNPTVAVTGSLPCTVSNGFQVVGSGSSSATNVFTFSVEDVTGDGDVDLTLAGRMYFDVEHCARARKTGAGTLLVSSTGNTFSISSPETIPFSLKEGSVLLGASSCFVANSPFSFDGGSLSSAPGVSNSVAYAMLTADSSLVLGEGSVMEFADSSACTWTSGAKLNVSGDVEKCVLRFGNSSSALSPVQLRALRWNGLRCEIDSDGRITPKVSGMVVIIM